MRKSAFQKIIVVLCIAISILLMVCACTKDDPQDTTTTADSTTTADVSDTTDTDADETTEGSDATTDSTVTYKVTVVDADGAPLAGATVQLCVGDQCQLPVATDANGVATIELAKADYTVKVTLAGYTGEAEYTFATDATELTVQLTKDAEDTTTEPEDTTTEPEETTTEPEETEPVKDPIKFHSSIDHINGMGPNGTANFAGRGGNSTIGTDTIDAVEAEVPVNADYTLAIGGWLGVDGGTAKFVFSVDGGNTWLEATGAYDGEPLPGHYAGLGFADATKLGMFNKDQAPVVADLSDYAGQTVTVTFAAVAASDNETIVPFVTIANYTVPEAQPEETTTEPEETTTEPEETTTEPEETTTEPEETTTEPEDNNSATNPIYVDLQWNNANTMATATVTAPVGTTYYAVCGAGMLLTVNDDEPIELIASGTAINAPAIFTITNDGDEPAECVLILSYPVGHKLNPESTALGYVDVTLEKGDYDGYYYTYTAEGNGTVTFYITSITEGVTGNIVIRNNTTGEKSSLLLNGVDNYGLELTVEVSEGDILIVQIVTEDIDGIMPAADVSWYGSFAYPLGSELNPIYPAFDDNGTATVIVPANTTYYFASYNLSSEVTFTANGVEVEVTYGMMRMPSTFTLTNDTDEDVEYTLQITYPVGTQMNPEVLFRPAYIAVNIAEGNNQGYYYKWTATSEGTLVLTCPVVEGVEYDVVLTNMSNYAMAWLSDSTDGTVSIEVAAGDEVIIQVVTLPDADWNYPALETAITGEFVFPIGHQSNPDVLFRPAYIAVNIAEGNNQGYYYKWTATSEGTLVLTCPVVEGVEYDVVLTNMSNYAMAWLTDSTDGTVSIEVAAGDEVIIQVVTLPDADWNYPALETAITGEFVFPVGNMNNPAALVIGENTAEIEAGNTQGYYLTYTAEAAGTLSLDISSNAAGWMYVVNNMTAYTYGDTQWSDSDPVVNPATIEVAAGDEIQIMVNTYDPADMWNTPAGTVIVKAAFTPAAE